MEANRLLAVPNNPNALPQNNKIVFNNTTDAVGDVDVDIEEQRDGNNSDRDRC